MDKELILIEKDVLEEILEKSMAYDLKNHFGDDLSFLGAYKKIEAAKKQFFDKYISISLDDIDETLNKKLDELGYK